MIGKEELVFTGTKEERAEWDGMRGGGLAVNTWQAVREMMKSTLNWRKAGWNGAVDLKAWKLV